MQSRFATFISAFALAAAACKSPQPDDQPAAPNQKRVVAQVIDRPKEGADKPQARPANILNGRIVGVRESLRFVVVDFAGGRMPQLDQRLNVYRLDQKVAEVKISGPYLGTTVPADVTAGDAMLGDLVRDK